MEARAEGKSLVEEGPVGSSGSKGVADQGYVAGAGG